MSDAPDTPAGTPGVLHPDPALVVELETVTDHLGLAIHAALGLAMVAGTERLIRAKGVSGQLALAATVGMVAATAIDAVHTTLRDMIGEDADVLLSSVATGVIASANGREPGADG